MESDSYMESLPFELVEKIADSLSLDTLFNLRPVSRQMKEYVDEILRFKVKLPREQPPRKYLRNFT